MTSIPPSPSCPLSITVPPRDIPTVDGCDDSQADTDIRPRLWMTAYEGQDPLEYAVAAAGMGREGNTGDFESPFSTFLSI